MGGGVCRHKAGALRAVMGQGIHAVGQFGVLAGAEAENVFFDQVAADQIADTGGAGKKYEPEPAAPAKIDHGKYEQEQVKRYPEAGFAQERQNGIEKTVGLAYIDGIEYFPVQWFNVPEPGNGCL